MKNRRLEIRLTEDELYEIDNRSKKLRMSRSKFLLQAALHQKIIVLDSTSIKQLTSELRKIGINMGKLECVHIEDTKSEIKKVWEELNKLRQDVKKLNKEN